MSSDERDRLIDDIRRDVAAGNGTFVDRFFGDVGVEELARQLENNATVKSLDLRGNRIGGSGARALAAMLERNTALQRFCVEWNSLGTDAAAFEELASAVGRSPSLKEVDLRNNRLTDQVRYASRVVRYAVGAASASAAGCVCCV